MMMENNNYAIMIFILIIGLAICSVNAGTNHVTCVCNMNHPRLAIRECPEKFSNVVAFMDLSDKNDFIHGVTETASPFCEPHLKQIRTPPGWSAILRNGRVGFVQLDYGDKTVNCTRHLTNKQQRLGMPYKCNSVPTANPTTQPTANPTAQPTANPTAQPTSNPTAQPTHTTTHATPILQSSVQCLKLETIAHVQKHEPVDHPLSRTCSGGEFESEAVLYKLCNNTHMSYWKKGLKIKDHCHDGAILSFTAVASFFHNRPIDAGIFIGCTKNSEIEIFSQTCGTYLKLKSITGVEVDDYYTIVL